MAGTHYQFAHIQTYARYASQKSSRANGGGAAGGGKQWTVGDVIREANRDPEHSQHVQNPKPPEQIAGCAVDELEAKLEEFLSENKLQVRMKNGKIAERKASKEAHVLLTAVYSWPEHVDYYDKERFEKWKEETLAFHEKEFGRVDCAVAHYDESFPHLHVYTFSPEAKMLNPGHRAKVEAQAQGLDAKDANRAYKAEMKAWQDRHFEDVGAVNGLQRLGPGRQRLSRPEWRKSKEARLEAADALRAEREKARKLTEQAIAAAEVLARERMDVAEKAKAVEEKAAEVEQKAKKVEENDKKVTENYKKKKNDVLEQEKKVVEREKTVQTKEKNLNFREKAVESREKMFESVGSIIGMIYAGGKKAIYALLKKQMPEVAAIEVEAAQKLEYAEKKAEEVDAKEADRNAELRAYKGMYQRAEKAIEAKDEQLSTLEATVEDLQELVGEQRAELAKYQPQPQPQNGVKPS